jgi:hypothetical protein
MRIPFLRSSPAAESISKGPKRNFVGSDAIAGMLINAVDPPVSNYVDVDVHTAAALKAPGESERLLKDSRWLSRAFSVDRREIAAPFIRRMSFLLPGDNTLSGSWSI